MKEKKTIRASGTTCETMRMCGDVYSRGGGCPKTGKLRKIPCKKAFVFIFFIFVGCTSFERQVVQNPEQIFEHQEASYEEDILPFIVEQINATAARFFYDREEANKIKGISADENEEPPVNAIVGNNEIGGVCADYALHFIENYKGPGKAYYIGVDENGTSELRNIKAFEFEKNDIILHDTETIESLIESFIENVYQSVLEQAKGEGAYLMWEDEAWVTFYTKTINKTIFWAETPFNSDTPLVPFRRKHIKVNIANYQAERDKERKKDKDEIYDSILQKNLNKERTLWEYRAEKKGLENIYFDFYTNENGKIFLVKKTFVPIPDSHAGETKKEEFFNHAWVRIIWNEMTIDVDPTWYDNGLPLEQVVEVIKMGDAGRLRPKRVKQ